MPPPRLSAASADRLQLVLDAADTAVDAGTQPNVAIAKAAQAHAMPVGHVPLAVRAFNTGRAVRQLGASDPWEKAAAYPQATIEGVVGVLSETPTRAKEAADMSDYHTPPNYTKTTKQAMFVPPPRQAEPTPIIKNAKDNTIAATFDVAGVLDDIYGQLTSLPAGAYAAVKAASLKKHPDAAAFVFGRFETDNPRALAKAAASIDPTVVTGSHPVVLGIEKLAFIKATTVYVDPDASIPDGWRKLSHAPNWAVKAESTRHLTLPRDREADQPAPAATTPTLLSTTPTVKAAAVKQAASFWGTANTFSQPLWSGLKSTTMHGAMNFYPGGADKPHSALSGSQSGSLDAGMASIDQQAAIQELMADPRFRHADPKTIVSTYRQLHSLAPQAFQNPAVAADYIQRRLQTGPLSSYDLKTLVDMNKSIMQSRRPDIDDE